MQARLRDPCGGDIYVMNVDGRNRRQLTTGGPVVFVALMGAISWSPDGHELAFAGSSGGIGIVGVDGRARRTIRFPNLSADSVSWQPAH